MTPVFHPHLVNDPFGDPGVYVDFLFEKRALLFDLGDLRVLPGRKMLRILDVCVSHAHMDHFFGFDWLLRRCLGRAVRIRLYGPAGFLEQVEHKLGAYTWNLVGGYAADFALDVTEVIDERHGRQARFRCRSAFRREGYAEIELTERRLLEETNLTVRFALLDHATPCLAFALEEKQHVNIWKNRLAELGLEPGPWLQKLKRAIVERLPEDTPIRATLCNPAGAERAFRLAELAGRIACITPGQKVVYITDAAYHSTNAARIVELAQGADQLFIEAVFGDELAERAAQKHHLTACQAGLLARRAGVKFPTPFHFSPIYRDREQALRAEFDQAFRAA